ncbi:Bil1p KNAG_0G03140 [Huiozyma naganishii CBS 8797]|uniref:Uncharacterized protein n=1 Tax=Huiozyma naganishii (strain ATCC MYA-139 / BCRC 22969 / CBS 8797 / KCTC 17520 / NBRC 10181 / NCYC 3082 / Yp74L-3) TaxID=1071383 RepID=J7S984_HUIN7|nr:hypothetical protein KNAG_0G03140 [Kazachstania naganishii CBS 8797]CCK71371.1 hypothetical protein KNAG_0G03140 [Kazachstania naganishii CBS 8797]
MAADTHSEDSSKAASLKDVPLDKAQEGKPANKTVTIFELTSEIEQALKGIEEKMSQNEKDFLGSITQIETQLEQFKS